MREWKFSQVFGERSPGEYIQEADIISAIEFESRGEYLATGDRGGRVVLFQKADGKHLNSGRQFEHMDNGASTSTRFVYKTEFQSHQPEFDNLKSLDIEEKIKKLRWCPASNNSLFILSTSVKTVKLWKVSERKVTKVKQINLSEHVASETALLAEKSFMTGANELPIRNGYHLEWKSKDPKITSLESQGLPNSVIGIEEGSFARCRKVYRHGHAYNIHSISNNSDGETFISADELRINLWNLENTNQCFNIVDMKPLDMEDLVEIMTSAEFDPTHCNILAYSSSRGLIRLVDMRRSALCDHNARILHSREAHESRSIFNEIVASISDIKFGRDGRHILSRDHMDLKLWDLHMERSPVAIFKIHENLRPKLAELYNNDTIFDKFDCCISGDGNNFASGSYSNSFRVFSRDGGHDGILLEASKNPSSATHIQAAQKTTTRLLTSFRGQPWRGNSSTSSDNGISVDTSSRIQHMAWHPTENLIACASANSLYTYYA